NLRLPAGSPLPYARTIARDSRIVTATRRHSVISFTSVQLGISVQATAAPDTELTTRMTKVLGIAAIALAMSLGLFASVALGVTLPSQANQHAVDATSRTHSAADVTGHPSADVNGVRPGRPP